VGANTAKGFGHAAAGGNMVVFEEDRVIEAEAVILAAAHENGVLLKGPQPRKGFSGIGNLGPRSCDQIDEPTSSRRNSRQVTQEVEGSTLTA